METQIPQDSPAQYWYGMPEESTPGVIEHWFYGVFEGGGAKGIAYSGALLAMKEQKCWFSRVAGASAGAITAALVASGLSPEEIENATVSGLGSVRTGIWAGLRRLQSVTGYFSSDGLRDWLDDLLGKQVSRKTGTKSDNVTFQQLWNATGIELNIVAADLSLRHQIIFSREEAANCVVADAVVASSSIPFAFPSRLLQVPESPKGRKQLYHHTVVDGGVWSNFPMFIFEDRAFRHFYGRDPEVVRSEKILGFLLQEEEKQELPSGPDVKFVNAVPRNEFRAREWSQIVKTVVRKPSSRWSKIGAWMLYPFSLLGRFAEWNGSVEPGRWPTPGTRLARNLVDSLNGLLGGIYPVGLGLLAWIVVVVGAWNVISFFSADELKALGATNWTGPESYVIRPLGVILTLLFIAVSILVVYASLLGVVANFILLRASRRILYGLVKTYVTGPGAPQWATKRSNIIALPTLGVTTTSFDMSDEDRRKLIDKARETTHSKLHDILVKIHGPVSSTDLT
jgi:predicted acylesterase/phospholipase RssA